MTTTIIDQEETSCQPPTGTPPYFSPTPDERTIPPQPTAHRNPLSPDNNKIYYKKGIEIEKRYGVPQTRRILTMGMFHKHHHDIRHQLVRLGLETRERDAIFKLLELYIYYGKVYPKAADIADQTYISKRTFWRAIGKLREIGAVEVLNRYVNHRQISNCYRLDKLVVMLARYLAEHGHNIGKWALDLICFFKQFWSEIWDADINLSLTAPIKLKIGGGG